MRHPRRATDRILDALNPPQREAVLHEKGPLLVLAGAGSGKTRVITHRIAYLLERGYPPESVLAITFTNKAADEMKVRTEHLCGIVSPWVSTFHSFCARLLRRHIHRLPPYENSFTICDAEDSRSLVRELLKELGIDPELWSPRSVQEEISRLKNSGKAPSQAGFLRFARGQMLRDVFEKYAERLRERNCVDFDDLLLLTVRLFEDVPEILEHYRGQFQQVLIDEYQDTNSVQYRIGRLLTMTHRNICITGDPDQSIYRWRGADVTNMLNFEHDYPDARVVTLDKNYRSTMNILESANNLIAHNEQRMPKSLWTDGARGDPVRVYRFTDDREEAQEVAALVQSFAAEGAALGDIAVFYRINSLSRSLEQELIYANIPYSIVGGIEFFLRKEVKDILAYLRILENPRDADSLRRIINVPPRGLGKGSLSKLIEKAQAEGKGLLQLVLGGPGGPRGAGELSLSKKAGEGLAAFAELYRKLAKVKGGPVADTVKAVIEATGYEKFLKDQAHGEAAREETANVWEVFSAASEYDASHPDGSLLGFLEMVNLLGDVDRWQRREDRVSLMTLHSAKGLEFPIVIIVGVEDGILPLLHAEDPEPDVEEERRLLYVGITRSQRHLYLTHVASRVRFGRARQCFPSRFLKELRAPEEAAEPQKPRAQTKDAGEGQGHIAGQGQTTDRGKSTGQSQSVDKGESASQRQGTGQGHRVEAGQSVEFDEGTARSLSSSDSEASGEERSRSRPWLRLRSPSGAAEVVSFEDFSSGAARGYADDGWQDHGDHWDPDGDSFPIGARVSHAEYGEGEVVRVSGVGQRKRVTVAFDSGEEAQFVLGIAPLKRVR